MIRSWSVGDLRTEYAALCGTVYDSGQLVSPRGVQTRELTNFAINTTGHGCTFPAGIGRGVSQKVLAAEMMQWIAGVSDLAQLRWAAANFTDFSDDGSTLYGAYGPRTHAGLKRVVRLLEADPLSRQATVSIWQNLEKDSSRDVPCTVSWSFMLRDGALHMTTFMRSNDVWTGVAYDLPIMGRIQSALAWALRVDVGTYTHIAQSFHIYERDVPGLEKMTETHVMPVNEPPFFDTLVDPSNITGAEGRWDALTELALMAVKGDEILPPEFAYYGHILAGSAHNPIYCDYCRYFTAPGESCGCR